MTDGKSPPHDGVDAIGPDYEAKGVSLALLCRYLHSSITLLFERDDTTLDVSGDPVLPRDLHQAIVQMMSMNQPPRVAERLFKS